MRCERGVGVGSTGVPASEGGSAGTGGTGDRGEVGDMGMREADGGCSAAESVEGEFVFAPPSGNDFFPPLGLLPNPNRAPKERIEVRLDPLFPLLPCESPERSVDALGESDFFLPTELVSGKSRG